MAANVGSLLFQTGSSGGTSPTSQPATPENMAGTSVARIKVSISLLFLIAVAGLVLLHRAGFRFSVTVG